MIDLYSKDFFDSQILPHLSSIDFFNLTATCKELKINEATQAKIELVKKNITDFINEYGAIAKCEAHISIKDLREKIENYFTSKDGTKWKEFKNSSNAISKEFWSEKFDKAYPLQDLKNKCKRVVTINEIHKKLLSDCEYYRYSFTEISKYYDNSKLFDIVQNPKYPINFIELRNFASEKAVILGDLILNLNKSQVICTIIAGLELNDKKNDLSKEIEIRLFQKYTSTLLGSLKVYKDGQNELVAEISGVSSFSSTEAEEENRISTIQCIMQMAVEIFMRESSSLLVLVNVGKYPTVSGGFSFYAKDFNKLDKLKNKIVKAREQGNLYPSFANGTESFKMHKTKSLKFGTQFVNIKEEEDSQVIVGPALVDFEMGSKPMTWEEKIKNNPLIRLPEGPFLPTFHTT